MRDELFEEIFSLVEEYINELEDEIVKKARAKRAKNVEKTLQNFLKVRDEGTPEEVEKAKGEWTKAGSKLCNIDKLRNLRDARREEAKVALAKFKEKLLNRKPQTAEETRQAATDHANAQITQAQRQKLERLVELTEGILTATNKELKSPRDIYNETTPEVETVKKVVSKKEE